MALNVVYGKAGSGKSTYLFDYIKSNLNKEKIYVITPEQFGFKRCKKEDLIGGNPQENAKFALDILNGAKGPKTDAVLLNAGAAIYTAREDITIEDGIKIAREALESGRAAKQLEDFAKATKQ